VQARIDLVSQGHETLLTLQIVGEVLKLHTSAVAVLLFAAVSALATIFWPILPALSALVPLALVLGVAAWLLVVSRLRTAGPHEFLQALEETLHPGAAQDPALE
jgi:hypothetical protein